VIGRPVLVDTGAWLAVFHRRDQYHTPAAARLRRLRTERTPLLITDLILAELHLHLLCGFGPAAAALHLGTITTDPGIEQVFCDRALQDAALDDWIRRCGDQPFSLTDAVSFAVMRARAVTHAFTFDGHVRVAGFEVVE